MKLVVGLGNVGLEYENTRHNVGFMYLDYLCGTSNFVVNKKFNAMEYTTTILGEKVIFVKPMTFMNLSGEAVLKYVNYYKINLDDVLVIQDDLDMPLGRKKLLYNHGAGGHNGIKNIILNLNSSSFLRLKIGISKVDKKDTIDYVLGKFNADELLVLRLVFDSLNSFVLDYVGMNRDILIGKYNREEV